MELNQKYKSVLLKYEINTPLRQAHFFGQLEHESGLKPIQENLNYSSEGLVKTFKKYFPIPAIANQYARQPQKIANKVYADRMGNGNVASGDGWKYSGKGFIQLTGKENYTNFYKHSGIDCVTHPELLLDEATAFVAACWFFKKNGLNELADKDDLIAITKRINGGTIGLADRELKVKKWKQKL